MKKKLFFFGLMLIVVAAITFIYIDMEKPELKTGTPEDFRALNVWDGSVAICTEDADADYYSGWYSEVWSYLGNLQKTDPLRKILGGACWRSDEKRMYLYVTKPTQQLRDQIQQEKACKRTEIVLVKCDNTFRELAAADQKLTDWLERAPESVKDSVQFYMVMPTKNRVAVWVKDWSDSDHAAMASAMGTDCGKFYLIQGDLNETAKQIRSMPEADWNEIWRQFDQQESGRNLISEEAQRELDRLYEEKTEERDMYRQLYSLIYEDEDWRMRMFQSLGQLSMVGYLEDMPVDSRFVIGSQRKATILVFYEQWEEKHENMVRAFFSHMFPEHGLTVILYPSRPYADLPF